MILETARLHGFVWHLAHFLEIFKATLAQNFIDKTVYKSSRKWLPGNGCSMCLPKRHEILDEFHH